MAVGESLHPLTQWVHLLTRTCPFHDDLQAKAIVQPCKLAPKAFNSCVLSILTHPPSSRSLPTGFNRTNSLRVDRRRPDHRYIHCVFRRPVLLGLYHNDLRLDVSEPKLSVERTPKPRGFEITRYAGFVGPVSSPLDKHLAHSSSLVVWMSTQYRANFCRKLVSNQFDRTKIFP